MNCVNKVSDLVGRILLAAIFLNAGIAKINDYSNTQLYMESFNVPGELLPLVILLEVIGAIMIIAGLKIQLAAYALALFSLMTAFIFHFDFSDHTQSIMFMKNLAIAGGFLYIGAHHAGAITLDKLFSSNKRGGIDEGTKRHNRDTAHTVTLIKTPTKKRVIKKVPAKKTVAKKTTSKKK